MNVQEATRIVDRLQQVVIATQPGPIQEAFSALVVLDGYWIVRRAEQFLAETHHATYKALADQGDDPAHRLTMDVFYTSLHEYAQDKPAEVDPSVEHDIPNWIEGNATAIASANIRLMEAALPSDEIPAHRALIEFHQHIDFAACEDEQNAALQYAWSVIEKRIEVFLAETLDTA
ncbi:MAG: hypothetical protein KDJ22_00045 [Candidatus Competibacteraceae bacterium]|nr:hypothetical protein [Candidatus Competibacteraceae bacterium]MCB1771568.1 hypothetical protein [Candidatus Competibacteraceae bacterium]